METLAGKGEGSDATEAECSKVPRFEDQIDVHTMHTSLPLLEAKQEKQQQHKVMYRTVPSDLMEVFSVRFIEFDRHALSKMYGCMLISGLPTCVVYSRKYGEPLNIDFEGYVKLQGPDHVIEPSDCIIFHPNLFRYEADADQFEGKKIKVLWNQTFYRYFDTLLTKRVRSQFGKIEVKYAAYEYGVVAHVDVTLTGCRFPSATVGGLITAQNSKLGEDGKSVLFKTDKNEGISINVSPCKGRIAKLPLARCKTAVPVHSSLTVDVDIWQCTIGAPDQAIAKNEKFKFVARLSGQKVKTFRGAACQVNVGVTWSYYADIEFDN